MLVSKKDAATEVMVLSGPELSPRAMSGSLALSQPGFVLILWLLRTLKARPMLGVWATTGPMQVSKGYGAMGPMPI